MVRLVVDESLELRQLTVEDAEAVFAVVDRNRARMRRWLPWLAWTKSADDTRLFAEQATESIAKHTGFHAIIWWNGEVAGGIGFRIDPLNHSASMGYWLDAAAEGQGIVTQAAKEMERYAFHHLGLNRIEIRCAVENVRSRAVPQRLGYQQEGIARQSHLVDGHFQDMAVYARVASDVMSS